MLYQIEFEKDAAESAGCGMRGWNPASLCFILRLDNLRIHNVRISCKPRNGEPAIRQMCILIFDPVTFGAVEPTFC